MSIYIYKGNSQISTNAIRNTKVVRALITKQNNKLSQAWGEALYSYTVGTYNYITITGVICGNIFQELNIPKYIDQKKVTSIASGAFADCINAKKITIPNTVENINKGVFSGCSSLESITIPFVGTKAGVTSSNTYQYPFGYIFGTSNYTGGVATQQYYYGSSTSSTTYDTYYIPSSLKSVTVTGGNILYGAFYNCTGLTSVIIPDSGTSIGDSAFRNCSSLTSIVIPDSVTGIGEYAFYNCGKLTSVTIGSGVQYINTRAFQACHGLTSITIPENIKYIGEIAFYNCTGITTVNWNAISCKTAGSSSNPIFEGCSKLATVNIGDNVTTIPAYSFRDCSSITHIVIYNRWLNSIGERAFYNCSHLTSIVFKGTKAQWNAITKGSSWDALTGKYTIYCTDGNIPK